MAARNQIASHKLHYLLDSWPHVDFLPFHEDGPLAKHIVDTLNIGESHESIPK